jgi:hypothetical protein
MNWVLIIILLTTGGVTTQEFHSQEACNAAANWAKTQGSYTRVICTPKGRN